MSPQDLEKRREGLINLVTQEYSNNAIVLEKFELLVTQLQAASTGTELEQIASTLPAQPATQTRDIICNHGNLKLQGPWLSAPAWRIEGKGSNLKLDLREYEDVEGLRVLFDLDLEGSNCKIILPFGWSLETRLDTIEGSNVKNRIPRGYPLGSNLIVVRGSLLRSNFKVRYKG